MREAGSAAWTPRCEWRVGAELGEGPVWVARDECLYFVDIRGRRIHAWRPGGTTRSWETPTEPGFIVPRAAGGFICGLRDGLYEFQPDSGTFKLRIQVESDRINHRLNDGFVDHTGRLWFGTMNDDCQTVGGALYSVERDGRLRVHDTGYVITNGPTVSADGRTLYHADSGLGMVYAFDLNDAGVLSNRRVFVCTPPNVYPDGMAVDREGNLWIALYGGWRLEKYSPRGEKLMSIRFPCANVSKAAFGGPDLSTLYVTTAWSGLSDTDRGTQPDAGALFSVAIDPPGLPATEARGL